jgi:hypothetical protein
MAGWHLSEQAREALRTARDLARGRRAAGSPDPLLMLPMSAAGRLLRELGVGYEDVVRHIEAEGARRVAGEDWRPEEHPLEAGRSSGSPTSSTRSGLDPRQVLDRLLGPGS